MGIFRGWRVTVDEDDDSLDRLLNELGIDLPEAPDDTDGDIPLLDDEDD